MNLNGSNKQIQTNIKENVMKNKFNSNALFAGMRICVLILLAALVLASCAESPDSGPAAYTITMEYNSEDGTANANPNPAVKGTMITINAFPASNHKFKSWVVVAGGITLTDIHTTPAAFTESGGMSWDSSDSVNLSFSFAFE